MPERVSLEFHCHTIFSKDSLTSPELLVRACQRKGIDRVVVTDHNTIRGALIAQAIDPQRVIVGEEIMTQRGELLAAFVKEEIPPGLPPMEAIVRLREQGAFISVSHPFDYTRSGHWTPDDLRRIAPLVDAVEVFNARCFSAGMDERAGEFAREHNLLGTVGSDAHTAFELGGAVQELPPFHDAITLRIALRQARYRVSRSGWWVRLASRYAVMAKMLHIASRG